MGNNVNTLSGLKALIIYSLINNYEIKHGLKSCGTETGACYIGATEHKEARGGKKTKGVMIYD